MKIVVEKIIGSTKYQFHIDNASEMEALHLAAVLGNPPPKCSCCGNDMTYLDSNKDKEANIYVNIVCSVCGAKAKLGQYKSKGYFWHEFKKYQKQTNTQEIQKPNNDLSLPEDEIPIGDEVPF